MRLSGIASRCVGPRGDRPIASPTRVNRVAVVLAGSLTALGPSQVDVPSGSRNRCPDVMDRSTTRHFAAGRFTTRRASVFGMR